MRGFYRVPTASVPAGETAADYGLAVLYESGSNLYVHASVHPHPDADTLGATDLGSTWQDLWANAPSVRDSIFLSRVERGGETLTIPRGDVEGGDTIQADGLPPHRWAGDPGPDPVSVS